MADGRKMDVFSTETQFAVKRAIFSAMMSPSIPSRCLEDLTVLRTPSTTAKLALQEGVATRAPEQLDDESVIPMTCMVS